MVKKLLPVFVLMLCTTNMVAAEETAWFYELGVFVKERQINFCDSQEDVDKIIESFSQHGPQKGYETLSKNKNCRLDVESFTPETVIEQLDIKSEDYNYTVSFLRVINVDDKPLFLFTTRPIKHAGH